MLLSEGVAAFAEALVVQDWAGAMVAQSAELGRHAQYAAGTLKELVTPLVRFELMINLCIFLVRVSRSTWYA